MTDAERAQRERLREGAGGITSYATDANTTVVAFAVGGTLFAGGLISGRVRRLDVQGPVFDPRPDPTARRIAYVSGRQLRVGELDGRSRPLAADGAGAGARRQRNGVVGSRRLHRRRGDGPVPRLLVESRRHRDRGVPRRRRAGHRVGDRRPCHPERARPNDPLSGGRDGQRHRHAARARARRLTRRRRLGPGSLPVRRDGRLDRRRPPDARPVPRSAQHDAAARRPGHRRNNRPRQRVRRHLGRPPARCPGLPAGRPPRDHRRRADVQASGDRRQDGHPDRSRGAFRRRRVRSRHHVPGQPARRRHRTPRVALARQRPGNRAN